MAQSINSIKALFQLGDTVQITGLQTTQYNDQLAEIRGPYLKDSGRWPVQLNDEAQTKLAVKTANIKRVNTQTEQKTDELQKQLLRAINPSNTDEKKEDKAAPKVFCSKNMNECIINAKYAVRGAIVQRANQIQSNITLDTKHPFAKVVFCNIGNPQAFCKQPITYHRQVLAAVAYPPLMDDGSFPKDVVTRAKRLLSSTKHQNIGAYTNSMGLVTVRESVANYLEKRDGFVANINHIFLTNGASAGITYLLQCLISSNTDGILIPIPQYPLYSATITLQRGVIVPYELDEDKEWSASLKSIENAIVNARKANINVHAICVINPGNPTGQCMTKECIDGIIEIANKYKIVIIADEVYQENIYYPDQFPFISFRKCLLSSSMKDSVELISVHSVSKGIFGECGLRGGYMELINIDDTGIAMVTKLASINLCPNTIGQCMVDIMINPPKDGDESYAEFKAEYEKQYESLVERAKILSTALDNVDGISCNKVYGAMYAFPNVSLPGDVVKNVAEEYKDDDAFSGKPTDFIYCMELLENYGACVVPGSGFGQKDGTFHFRTTLLPPKDEIEHVVQSIASFHKRFISKYS